MERLASAMDYALEQVCLAMNADSRTVRRLADEKLRHALADGERLRDQLENENCYLRREVTALQGTSLLVGASKALRLALDQVSQVAPTRATVLLVGETGTGKELFASQIHDLSPRRNRSMVRVNCPAIPSALIESELFGREKGAYTGALLRQAGRFEVADKSTLFLDEIGDLPLEMQVKLLRVLQERQIERLGSSKSIDVDVRIVAATNRDLEKQIADGSFREDLYLSAERLPDSHSASAGTPRGHPDARLELRGRIQHGIRQADRVRFEGQHARIAALSVAGKRPRAAQRR